MTPQAAACLLLLLLWGHAHALVYPVSDACSSGAYVYLPGPYTALTLPTYADNMDCSVVLVASTTVTFALTSLSLESCCDRVTLYDGPTASHPVLATLTGTLSSGTFRYELGWALFFMLSSFR
jgi:hypothetical protein